MTHAEKLSTMASPHKIEKENRRQSVSRHQTAPSMISVNGHLPFVDEKPAQKYGKGIQIIDEDQVFKYSEPQVKTCLTY